MKRSLPLAVVLLFVAGCTHTHHMGDFTVASTQNVRNLSYGDEGGAGQQVQGETCINDYFFFRSGPEDARLQRAMDDAIAQGRKAGVNGDMLVNVRIEHENRPFRDCLVVTGMLVNLDE